MTNIQSEYEQLYGSCGHVCLFDSEEEYQSLIGDMTSALPGYDSISSPLPFEGIGLRIINRQQHQSEEQKQNNNNDKRAKTSEVAINLFDTKSDTFFIFRKDAEMELAASGHIDPYTLKFILHKGSTLSFYIKGQLSYSMFQQRANIILRHCTKQRHGFYLNQDIELNSPHEAAMLVQGMMTDGYQEWQDTEGNTLGQKMIDW